MNHRSERYYIYLIGSENWLKVGVSVWWKTRLIELQKGVPFNLSLVGLKTSNCYMCRSIEKRIMDRCKQHRSRGEWFHRHQDVLDAFIAEGGKLVTDDRTEPVKPPE